jgi:hypothetical protein
MTYQPQKSSFTVKVKDYRARVKFEEESAIVNSALIRNQVFKMKNSEVYPATGCTVTYTHAAVAGSTDPDPITAINTTTGVITLGSDNGKAVITAKITAVPAGYEMKTFKDANDEVKAEFTLEVKEGVAYISGYDATGKPDTTYMYKDFNGEKYTVLNDKLTGSDDVYLDAGWYYLNADKTFAKNIRAKGNVNIILGRSNDLNLNDGTTLMSILDESAKKNYEMNIFSEPAKPSSTLPAGTLRALRFKDFKDVNVCGASVYSNVETVGSVNNVKGTIGNLNDVATVSINEGTVGNLQNIETLTINKSTIGQLVEHIGTASIAETEIDYINDVKTLDLKKVTTVDRSTLGMYDYYPCLSRITTLNIDKTSKIGSSATDYADVLRVETANINGAKVYSDDITANALNINGGEVNVSYKITGFDKNGAAANKITMTDGKLTVGASLSGDNYAVFGDVTVTKGEFTASSKDYHAVDGTLTGKFYGKATASADWALIDGTSSTNPFITTVEPTPAP